MNVTIIIPVHKERGYLDEAIISAIRQDFLGSWQIILASDGNPDLEKYAMKYGIDFTLAPKGNLSSNQNAAMKIAKGKYIKLHADDDIMLPNALTDLFDNIGDNAVIHANVINFSDKGETLYVPPITEVSTESLLTGNYIHGGSVMILTEAFLEVGGYDESLDCAEEYDLYFKLLKKGYGFTYVNKTVFRYRRHSTSKSLHSGTPHRRAVRAMIQKKYGTK